MDFPRHKKNVRPIALIPMIDVIVILTIYFMMAGHIEKFAVLEVDPPAADSGQLLNEGPVVVVIGKHEEILVNDELYEMKELEKQIKRQLEYNPERIITVKADAKLAANRLIEIMDRIKLAGGKNLSLVTQSLGGGK